jgi:hypothetical protein
MTCFSSISNAIKIEAKSAARHGRPAMAKLLRSSAVPAVAGRR